MKGIEQRPGLYDAGMRVLNRLGLSRWRRSLVSEGPVLEVGCGTGLNLPLYPTDAWVVGLDPDPNLLRAARHRAPEALLVQGRAEALPFRDGAFDTVVSSLVFCSVEDPAAGLREVARVLRPGGRLRMLEHVRPRGRLAGWLSHRMQPAWTRVAGGCRPDRDTVGAVQAAGFTIDPGTYRARSVFRRFDAVVGKPGPDPGLRTSRSGGSSTCSSAVPRARP